MFLISFLTLVTIGEAVISIGLMRPIGKPILLSIILPKGLWLAMVVILWIVFWKDTMGAGDVWVLAILIVRFDLTALTTALFYTFWHAGLCAGLLWWITAGTKRLPLIPFLLLGLGMTLW